MAGQCIRPILRKYSLKVLLLLIYGIFSSKASTVFYHQYFYAFLCQKGRSGQGCFYEFPRRSSRWLAWISLVHLCWFEQAKASSWQGLPEASQVLPLDPRTGAGWGPGQRCQRREYHLPPHSPLRGEPVLPTGAAGPVPRSSACSSLLLLCFWLHFFYEPVV